MSAATTRTPLTGLFSVVDLAARVGEVRDACRSIFGAGWQDRINQVAPFIRVRMKQANENALQAALALATPAVDDGKESIAMVILGVGAELAEEPK